MTQFIMLPSEKSALLVIDVQRALFTRPTPVYEDRQMIGIINGLVDRAHLYNLSVIYIQHSNKNLLIEESDGWKLHPAMKPIDGDYSVYKKHGNAFQDTTLQSILESRGITNLIITGMVTQGCIRATSLGGIELGYQVFLVKGGHSNYNKDAPRVIEEREAELEGAGVHLVHTDQLAFS